MLTRISADDVGKKNYNPKCLIQTGYEKGKHLTRKLISVTKVPGKIQTWDLFGSLSLQSSTLDQSATSPPALT